MLYQLAYPDTQILICPVDCCGITKDNWYTFAYGIERVLGELARCGNQFADEISTYLLTNTKERYIIVNAHGDMAQLVERLVRNEEASGSNPLISTKTLYHRFIWTISSAGRAIDS